MPTQPETIRVGVVGVGRGQTFARVAPQVGMRLVALCDTWEERLSEVGAAYPNVATYADFGAFLDHEMDAVVLANYFHQHAPLAIQALGRGMHVLSEVSACKTLAEAVALIRAVEASGRIYMMAENCCYYAHIQEMQRLYRADEIGELRFAECEYLHPDARRTRYLRSAGMHHWRHWMPPTYYCTHALGPILTITNLRPAMISALSIPNSSRDLELPHIRPSDAAAAILCRLDNEAVVQILGLNLRGASHWYRLHGTRGLMENLRTLGDEDKLRVVHDAFDLRPGDVRERIYLPEFPFAAERARGTGHRGADYYTSHHFAEAIRTGARPMIDVYRAVDMTIVGIQAWKSCLQNGTPIEVPDLRQEAVRARYADEDWSPYPEDARPDQPPSSVYPHQEPTPDQIEEARRTWDEIGYRGQ
jgi:predicted dehydrogenase